MIDRIISHLNELLSSFKSRIKKLKYSVTQENRVINDSLFSKDKNDF